MRDPTQSLTRWHHLPHEWHIEVAAQPGSVLLQTSRFDAANRHSFLFFNPLQTIAVHTLDEIPEVFRRLEHALADGFYAAGFLSYECGYHFERFEHVQPAAHELPLAWFGIYRKPLIFDHATGCFEGDAPLRATAGATPMPATNLQTPSLAMEEDVYREQIEKIKAYIRQGDTYQVNFTSGIEMPAPADADAAAAFASLLHQQPVAYSAFLNIAGHRILSFSPELFFRTGQGRITTRPM